MTATETAELESPPVAAAAAAAASARPISRRRFLRGALACAAAPLALGAYAREVEPYWLETHELPITIPGLPAEFDGFRIAHLTDMHAGHGVPYEYLAKVMREIQAMRPDCVAVTGDLIDHTHTAIEPVAELLGNLNLPVVICFGNHDYCPHTARPRGFTILADPLQRALQSRGCTVLRNASMCVSRGEDARLWFVGLEDLYTTRFSPAVAFGGVNRADPIVALSHNPDSAIWLQRFGAKLVLSGHTHGGQVRIPLLGAPVLPLLNRRFEQGLFQLHENDCQMYVSRGVGFLAQARFCCRPELPLIILRRPA